MPSWREQLAEIERRHPVSIPEIQKLYDEIVEFLEERGHRSDVVAIKRQIERKYGHREEFILYQ